MTNLLTDALVNITVIHVISAVLLLLGVLGTLILFYALIRVVSEAIKDLFD